MVPEASLITVWHPPGVDPGLPPGVGIPLPVHHVFIGRYGPAEGVHLTFRSHAVSRYHACLRAHADGWAEMKRLYVRPAGRGHGLGKRLVVTALAAAERLGCHTVKLATAPGHMDQAVALYRSLGFRETARFDDLCFDGVLYLERQVQLAATPIRPNSSEAPASGWRSS